MALTSLWGMFGRSPIRPLEQHMNKAHACAESLLPFFEAVLSQDWPTAKELQRYISEQEGEADALKRDIRLHLPKGLFLPVSRNDLLMLLIMQDRIANKAEDIAGLVIGREMQIPEEMAELFMSFVSRCVDASKQARKAINELDELLETGFSGNEVEVVQNMIVKLDQIETDTDQLQRELRQQLFARESQMQAIDVIFLYKLIDWLGDLADRAQTVGGDLQLLLAR